MFFSRRQTALRARRKGPPCGRTCRVEPLELRDLLSALPIAALADNFVQPLLTRVPLANPSPALVAGYGPAQLRHAYGFDQVALPGGASPNGTGETIAIIDAFDAPNLAGDLAVFDAHFGLPAPPSFVKVSESGSSTLPATNASWAQETSLDVEWAHAIAPGASILLVEANSASDLDLGTAVNYARNQPGVVAVSMSWGGSEFPGEQSVDALFTAPANHPGVAFVTSSGDNGAGVSWPASSANVLSVGGTTLKLDRLEQSQQRNRLVGQRRRSQPLRVRAFLSRERTTIRQADDARRGV